MSTRSSAKIDGAFKRFKEDVKYVTLMSKETGAKKRVLKYKDKVYNTACMRQAFSSAREAGDVIIPDRF